MDKKQPQIPVAKNPAHTRHQVHCENQPGIKHSGQTEPWNPQGILLYLSLAICMVVSWLIPQSRQIWQAINEWVFFSLNGSLSAGEHWALLWAWLNTSSADVLLLTLMLAILLQALVQSPGKNIRSLLFEFGLLIVLMLVIRQGFSSIAHLYSGGSDSPSLILNPVNLLSEIFPGVQAKDHSTQSYPADHATLLFTWYGYVTLRLRSSFSGLALLIAILFILPRLVSGAHWFTDVMIGGAPIALISLSLMLHTPIFEKIRKRLQLRSSTITTNHQTTRH